MATTTATKQFIPCDDACMFAKGTDCECPCNGENHQVGTKGLLPAEYAEVVRTRAGRRINPHFTDQDQKEYAEWALAQHEAGMTKREIAKALGVSPSTVRRYITRLLLAEEMAWEQEEQNAATVAA